MYFAARYDLVMLSERELDAYGNSADGSIPPGKCFVVLGDGFERREDAEEAVRIGNEGCLGGEQLNCKFTNGETYAGPRYRFELVSED